MKLPNIIGICGKPQTGKSTVSNILQENFGFIEVDDAEYIRRSAMEIYKLKKWHVYTKEGKSSYVTIPNGERWLVRDLLSFVGECIETKHGRSYKPIRAISNIYDRLNSHRFVFPSVRGNEAAIYNQYGGMIIQVSSSSGISNEEHSEADDFDPNYVDVIINNTSTIENLKEKLLDIFNEF